MAQQLVFKVKYGDTLRRFTSYVPHPVHRMSSDAYVRELNMSMDGLKAKIISLFNLDSDAKLNITYIDEDDDVVTLVNDEDLSDAIQQRINPLRLEVTLNNPKLGEPTETSGNSTPSRSPWIIRDPSAVITSGLEEALKSLPEPISTAISGLSQHLPVNATEAAPVIREIVEQLTGLVQIARSIPGFSSQARDDSETMHVDPPVSAMTRATNNPVSATASQVKSAYGITPIGHVPPLQPVAPSTGSPLVPPSSNSAVELDLGLESAAPVGSSAPVPNSPNVGIHENGRGQRGVCFMPNVPPASYGPPRAVHPVCPFSDMKFETAEMQTPWPSAPVGVTPSMHSLDALGQCFHKGVICDGCGMHPIVGPRYRSKVMITTSAVYVSQGFTRMGNEGDYTRMDRAAYRPPHTVRDFYKNHPRFGGHHGRMPGSRHCKLKLESRFIKDVTILDGTVVAPNTPFTKIWRMRNSGTLPWPARSQLMWIGGDRMGNATSVDLEIPEYGFPVEEELEIAVDFVSPSRPGRYASYWRMTSPTGQKFGQRVWVLIQVEMFPLAFIPHPHVSVSPLNLNLLPQCTEDRQKGIELMDFDIPAPTSLPKERMDNAASTSADHPSGMAVSEIDPVVHPLSEDNKGASPLANIPSSPIRPFIPYPTVNASGEGPVEVSDRNGAIPVEVPVSMSTEEPFSTNVVPGDLRNNVEMSTNEAEEALLKELAEMGFKQIDLNKEVLRRNEYDLEQSVDDLCSASEWDTILDELKEMGFCDMETNRKLLAKNDGSIKRVVLDLISGRK